MRLRLIVATVAVSLWCRALSGQTGVLAGSVNTDSALTRALAGADLSIPALGLTTRSNVAGDYRFAGIAPGRYLVVVSCAGYKPIGDSVTVAVSGETFWDFVLATRVTVLDSVVTTAKSPLRQHTTVRLQEFEERRSTGKGYFIAEDELRQNDHRRLADILTAHFPGTQITRPGSIGQSGTGAGLFLASVRGTGQSLTGGTLLCYPEVYIDGARLAPAPSPPAPPRAVDISSLDVNLLAGVEFYQGAATTPTRYNSMANGCGVLLLWTRER